MTFDDQPLVTCDECDNTSESGWGDHPNCIDCVTEDEICNEHDRTFVFTCSLCDLENE